MNVFRILTPCVLQRRRPKEVDNSDKRDCWFVKRRRGDASYMIHRMGASASSSITSVGGDSIQAARLSSSGNPPDQHGIAIREKKKKMTGFATLRKKFIRRRRSSKACDHGRIIRDLVFNMESFRSNCASRGV
uniref:Uncharacterized protein n=1 Tax=Apis cerana TaxID=7461 RepID=V9IEG6_APICE